MKFYTACALKGNKVLVRGYDNGVRFTDTIAYKPSLYIKSDSQSKYKGHNCCSCDKTQSGWDRIKDCNGNRF